MTVLLCFLGGKPADDRAKALVGRARLFVARSRLDLALADADAAIQLNPKFVPALLARALVYEQPASSIWRSPI